MWCPLNGAVSVCIVDQKFLTQLGTVRRAESCDLVCVRLLGHTHSELDVAHGRDDLRLQSNSVSLADIFAFFEHQGP